jgi:hypothetical protein
MQRPGTILALTAALIAPVAATPAPRVGDAVQITTDQEMEEHGNRADSQQGTSADRDSYVERVTAGIRTVWSSNVTYPEMQRRMIERAIGSSLLKY